MLFSTPLTGVWQFPYAVVGIFGHCTHPSYRLKAGSHQCLTRALNPFVGEMQIPTAIGKEPSVLFVWLLEEDGAWDNLYPWYSPFCLYHHILLKSCVAELPQLTKMDQFYNSKREFATLSSPATSTGAIHLPGSQSILPWQAAQQLRNRGSHEPRRTRQLTIAVTEMPSKRLSIRFTARSTQIIFLHKNHKLINCNHFLQHWKVFVFNKILVCFCFLLTQKILFPDQLCLFPCILPVLSDVYLFPLGCFYLFTT